MNDTIERAFALARSGRFRTIDELRRALFEEGEADVDTHLSDTEIRKQLRQEMAFARTPAPDAD